MKKTIKVTEDIRNNKILKQEGYKHNGHRQLVIIYNIVTKCKIIRVFPVLGCSFVRTIIERGNPTPCSSLVVSSSVCKFPL